MLLSGTEEQFSTLRDLLMRAGFDETQVCARFGIDSLENFESEFDRVQAEDFEKDALGVLIQLFIEGQYVDEDLALRHFGSDAVQSMAELGLIERGAEDGQIAATAALYPTAGVWIASDRWNNPDRSAYTPRPDVVYPAIVSNAQRFLRLMPPTPCRTLLDLCSGTGVAGLHAASYFADQVWAFDISERSAEFAGFNRRLNGLQNVTVGQGDLYEPAQGRRFQRIVAHPPYVPVLRPKWVYHDGGEDGEQVVRRCVEGIPAHLEPGGLFYLLAMASDREGEPYERRVRRWLGESADEFDVAVFVLRSADPEDFAARAVLNSEKPNEDFREFRRLIQQLGVREMVYSVLLVQRRTEERPVFTGRRQAGPQTGIREMLAALAWETQLLQPGAMQNVLQLRLRANEEAEMRVRHVLGEEGWEAADYTLRAGHPFSMEARTDPWAPYLMAHCDGTRTVAELFDLLKAGEALPEGTAPEDFARALAVLVSGGFLLVEQD